MAQRRMIGKIIFNSDKFTDLPIAARLLYTYMILNADDEGMLSNIKQLLFQSGAKNEDLTNLIENGYVLKFESGVFVIRHWLLMNRVQETRKTATAFINELSQLEIDKDNSYKFCQQNADKLSTQCSIGQYQSSIGQVSKVKDSTVQGSKEKLDDLETQKGNNFSVILSAFENNKQLADVKKYFTEKIGVLRNIKEFRLLQELYECYGYDDLIICIDIAAEKEAKTVQYLEKVCNSHNED